MQTRLRLRLQEKGFSRVLTGLSCTRGLACRAWLRGIVIKAAELLLPGVDEALDGLAAKARERFG